VAEEISAAVSKLTGEAQTNGEVYVSAVKKAAAKVRYVSAIKPVCAWSLIPGFMLQEFAAQHCCVCTKQL